MERFAEENLLIQKLPVDSPLVQEHPPHIEGPCQVGKGARHKEGQSQQDLKK